jgi:hypothetical protein
VQKVPAARSDYQHPNLTSFPIHLTRIMAASALSGRLTLSDPSVKELAQASCVHEKYYDALPKLQGEANWQEWSDALQHAALMAGTDGVLNGESKHPKSLEGKQCTTSEWNDNVKRTAVWRSRNESLLKAMRGAADVDFDDFGASNAHDTHVSLSSKYHTSDNQQVFKLYSEDLLVRYDLKYSPKGFANNLQDAFNKYNQLVGDNIKQRLPENFLKLAFLDSLDSGYRDWRMALLRDRDVLALGQESTLTFNELVELAVVEHGELLQEQTKTSTPEPAPSPPEQQAQKRNLSQVDRPAQSDLHRLCSVPHHISSNHTNQTCKVQNPRLRQSNWIPTKADQIYLAKHPEVENPQIFDDPSDRFVDRSENESETGSENDSEDNIESDSESEDERSQEISAGGQDDSSVSDQDDTSREGDNENEMSDHEFEVGATWKRFAASRYAEVQAQIDLVTGAVGGHKKFGRKVRKHAPLVGDLSGKWLLYSKEHISDTTDHYRIQLWQTTTEKQRQQHPGTEQYQGKLSIEPHGHPEKFRISSFSPSPHVTSRPTPMQFGKSGGERYKGKATFWGNGKMLVTLPPPVLNLSDCNLPRIEFAGLRSSVVANPRVAGTQANTGRHDEDSDHEVSTGAHSTGVAIKVEQNDSDVVMDDDDQDSRAMAIEAEESGSSVSDDESADDFATIMDIVQKQKDVLRGGLIVPLQDLSGMWYFHSPDYQQDPGQDIQISFYDRVEHGPAERMCAPGHCKPSTDQIHYCGELRFKGKKGERDWSCLIKQFDVPKQTSVASVKIQSWDPISKRVIFITAWFLGGGAMCMSLPTTYIPNYQGQKAVVTFSGVKRQ